MRGASGYLDGLPFGRGAIGEGDRELHQGPERRRPEPAAELQFGVVERAAISFATARITGWSG